MATINPESVNPDSTLVESFPYILKIEPVEKSFYTSLAFSVLFRLACVSQQMKKEVVHKLREYISFELKQPNISQDLNISEELQDGINKFPQILESAIDPNNSLKAIENNLKIYASSISAAFQVILASIFAKSHKIPEAQDILDGKKVLCQNVYYFENFAKSLTIRLVIHVPGENAIDKMDDKIADRLNVELFVVNKQTSEFAVMRHQKEIDLMRTLNNSFVNEMPFVFIRKKNFVPVSARGNSDKNEGGMNLGGFTSSGSPGLIPAMLPGLPPPQFNNVAPNLPNNPGTQFNNVAPNLPNNPGSQFNNVAPNLPNNPGTQFNNVAPNLPNMPGPQFNSPMANFPFIPGAQFNPIPGPPSQNFYHNQMHQNNPMQSYNKPQDPKPANPQSGNPGEVSQQDQEMMFINELVPILIDNSTMLNKSEFRVLKKFMKNIRSQNKSLMTEEIKRIKEITDNYCKKDHDPTNFVIFKTCKKRHCKICLSDCDDSRVICDCRKEISGEDLTFILGKAIKCFLCSKNIDDPSQKVGTTHFMHRECAMRIN